MRWSSMAARSCANKTTNYSFELSTTVDGYTRIGWMEFEASSRVVLGVILVKFVRSQNMSVKRATFELKNPWKLWNTQYAR